MVANIIDAHHPISKNQENQSLRSLTQWHRLAGVRNRFPDDSMSSHRPRNVPKANAVVFKIGL